MTIHIPRAETPAGAYRGTLAVESDGRTATLPVALEVFDFAVPETSYLKTSFWLFRHPIRNHYGWKSVPFGSFAGQRVRRFR